jgi:hypothetical protein
MRETAKGLLVMARYLIYISLNKKTMSQKLLFFLILFFSATISRSQVTRISIASGNWNNPAIWSPAGVPTLSDDTIIINTDVTFNQRIVDGQSLFRVNAGASLIDLGNDTAGFGGDMLVINGYFSVNVLAVGMVDTAVNNGTIVVGTNCGQSGIFLNNANAQFCVGQQLATSDDFINNGSVKTNNWANGAAVTGNGGKFCIANYFINSDNISGNIDICDATPNSPFDVNSGTIAGSVTYCAVGPCGLCPAPNGIADNFSDGSPIKVFPNPFSTSTQIQINPGLLNTGMDLIFVMYDVNGKEVRNEAVSNPAILVDRGNLSNGIYFYRLILNGNPIADGKIIAE